MDFIRDQRDKTRLNVFLRVDLGDAGTVGAALRCSQKNYDVTFFADQKSVLNRLEAHAPELRRILDGVSHEFSRTDAKLAGSFVAFQDLRHADSGLRQSSFGEQRQERHPNRSPLNNPDANQSDKTGPIACLYYSNVSF